MKNKRTDVDFSKHVLTINKNENCIIYRFQLPNTKMHSVVFINAEGVMCVTGDFGNWIFNREFHPSAEGRVSDGYWLEKLSIASSQKYKDYDSDKTVNELNEYFNSLKKEDYTEYEYEEIKEHFEYCTSSAEDYYEYICNSRNIPNVLLNDDRLPIISESINYF